MYQTEELCIYCKDNSKKYQNKLMFSTSSSDSVDLSQLNTQGEEKPFAVRKEEQGLLCWLELSVKGDEGPHDMFT